MTVQIDFQKYHRYDELVGYMRALEAAHPGFARMYSIGKSYEGREMWLMELTNQATGPADEKPGYYIDGNIHAGEVTGAVAALYAIWYLLANYGTDPEVTRLLDSTSFYILPRVSPDGAEKYLTTPYMLRSSVRPYPFEEEQDGFYPEDVDGNGLILQMRVEDPDGEWKVSARDGRLMIPRRPDDFGGTYYRLFQEGLIRNYDGVEIKVAPPRSGLDMNRNFPVSWEPDAKQSGAGPYPLSEPETRAVADFLINQKNITGGESFHTATGIILRASSLRSDEKMNPKDRTAFKAIGKMGEELTSYPCVSVYDGYAYQKDNPIKGCFLDWCYDNLGLMMFSTELWDLRTRVGMDRVPFLTPLKDRDPEAEGLMMLQWLDRECNGDGFVAWYDIDHPQLGKVQLGGWRMKDVLQNPPTRFLKAEAHKNALFTLKHAAALPHIEVTKATAEHLGDGVFKVEVIVRNRGYLPTNVTEMARQIKTARPVTVELALPAGAELVLGKQKEELGHLEGRVLGGAGFYPGSAVTQKEKRVEWIIKAPQGGELLLKAVSEKAGRQTVKLQLKAEA